MKAQPFELVFRRPDGTETTVGTIELVSEPAASRPKPEPKGCADSSLPSFGAEIARHDGSES